MTDAGDMAVAGEAALYALFERAGISWTHYAHPPVFTVEESQAICGDIPGAHVKNMFLKDKKGQAWLVTCLDHRQIRIRDLEKEIGAAKASFGKPELLWECLGVRPGSVSPFGLLNDTQKRVRVVLDRQLLDADPINAHPLHNAATTAVSPQGLLTFLSLTGHEPIVVDFDRLEALEAARRSDGESQ